MKIFGFIIIAIALFIGGILISVSALDFVSAVLTVFIILLGVLSIKVGDTRKEMKNKDKDVLQASTTTTVKPRRIPKYAYEEVLVVGAKHLKDKSGIKEAEEYDTVYLIPEPDNPYDPDAIRVEDTDERKLGYISKDSNIQSMIHDFRRRGDDVEAMIDGVSKEGVTLNIQFFRD